MSKVKLDIEIDQDTLQLLNRLADPNLQQDTSSLVEAAIRTAARIEDRQAFLRGLKDLDPSEEIAIAEEFLESDLETWPEY